MGSSPWVVPDELWERIEPLLPKRERRFRYPGRRPVPDRVVLCGILYVLHTGIQWEFLPQELGFGSGMTCWRRLRDWNEAGVWQRLHEVLLAELNAAARLDWSRCVVDSSHVRALKGGSRRGRRRSTGGWPGSKHHLICDGHGTPLAVILTGGNRNDVTQLMPLIDAVPPVRGRVGHPRRRPDSLFADRGYDHDIHREQVRARGIIPAIARRGTRHGTASAPTVGSSSGPSPGSTASNASAPAGNTDPTSTKPSSNSPAASSPTDNSSHCVRRC